MNIANMIHTSMIVNGRKALVAADKVAKSITFDGSKKIYTFKDKSVLIVGV